MKFTLLAVILMIGIAAGVWVVERFFPDIEESALPFCCAQVAT